METFHPVFLHFYIAIICHYRITRSAYQDTWNSRLGSCRTYIVVCPVYGSRQVGIVHTCRKRYRSSPLKQQQTLILALEFCFDRMLFCIVL